MSLPNNAVVIDTAEAINRYLSSRPNASETLDGVAKWWLLRQRYNDSSELVQQALDLLIVEGIVIKSAMPDGKVMYSRVQDLSSACRHQPTQVNSPYTISSEEQ